MKPAVTDFKQPPHERVLSRLNKVLIVLTVASAGIPFSNFVMPGVKEKAAQDDMIAAIETELDEARTKNSRLARGMTMLRNDPDYLGLFVRDGLEPGYMDAGETIFRLSPIRSR